MNIPTLLLTAAARLTAFATRNLVHKSLHLRLPNVTPYDTDYALEAFVGEHVLPISEHLHWFWFSRYGGVGAWEIRFRFSTTDFKSVRGQFEMLSTTFAHGTDGCGDYDFINDLGGSRFLGQDAPNADKRKRATLVYEFLTASSKLFLKSIVRELDGHWRHERETKSGLNRETSLESAHHLFCNMTNVPTWGAIIQMPNVQGQLLVSDLQSRAIRKNNAGVQELHLAKIQH